MWSGNRDEQRDRGNDNRQQAGDRYRGQRDNAREYDNDRQRSFRGEGRDAWKTHDETARVPGMREHQSGRGIPRDDDRHEYESSRDSYRDSYRSSGRSGNAPSYRDDEEYGERGYNASSGLDDTRDPSRMMGGDNDNGRQSGGRSSGGYGGGYSGGGYGAGDRNREDMRDGFGNRGGYGNADSYQGRDSYGNRGGSQGQNRSGNADSYQSRENYGGSYGNSYGNSYSARGGMQGQDQFADRSYQSRGGSDTQADGYASSGDWMRGRSSNESRFNSDGSPRNQKQSFAGKGPKGWQRSDDRIREEVSEALARDHEIDARDIEVEVKSAEVTLSGIVADRPSKRMAEEVAEGVFGVNDVQNRLRVKRSDDSDAWSSESDADTDKGSQRASSSQSQSGQSPQAGQSASSRSSSSTGTNASTDTHDKKKGTGATTGAATE